jgi:hypothetical protein
MLCRESSTAELRTSFSSIVAVTTQSYRCSTSVFFSLSSRLLLIWLFQVATSCCGAGLLEAQDVVVC